MARRLSTTSFGKIPPATSFIRKAAVCFEWATRITGTGSSTAAQSRTRPTRPKARTATPRSKGSRRTRRPIWPTGSSKPSRAHRTPRAGSGGSGSCTTRQPRSTSSWRRAEAGFTSPPATRPTARSSSTASRPTLPVSLTDRREIRRCSRTTTARPTSSARAAVAGRIVTSHRCGRRIARRLQPRGRAHREARALRERRRDAPAARAGSCG